MSDLRKKQLKVKRLKNLMKGTLLSWVAVKPGDEEIVENSISHKNKLLGKNTLELIRMDRRILFNVPHKWHITLQAHFKDKHVDEYEIIPQSECTIDQIDNECMEIANTITKEEGFDYFKYILEIR